ncbi:MAG: FtsX-like permease family protein, partial [Chitinophagales bacterium]
SNRVPGSGTPGTAIVPAAVVEAMSPSPESSRITFDRLSTLVPRASAVNRIVANVPLPLAPGIAAISVLLVKLETNDLTGSMAKIENEFKKIVPSAFEFTFLDQQLDTLYKSEEQLGQIILIFSGLAIFIACLGLYALAAYTTEQRTKEIGIRKVMGASVIQLSNMLSKDFLKLVVISFVIAVPLAYYAMTVWLQGFAYRIEINLLIFVLAGVISILIAWFTVGFESFKAARSNPMKSLRSE